LSRTELDIGLHVLDHQLLDKNGRRCGNVDDLAIWIGGGAKVRIEWADITKVDSAVHLKRDATELGLGRGDDRLRPYAEKIPGAGR